MRRFCLSIAVAFVVLVPCLAAAQTPGSSTTDRAKRILDLLVREQFDEVAKEFNEKMTAAMPVTRLRDTWTKVRQQAGAYVSAIDESVTTPGPGFTAVVLGCQFERAALNIRIGFDGQNKIGGFGIVPRPPASEPPATPTSTKFKDEQVTIGTEPWTLPATLSMPVGPIAGAIALVHGSGPHDRDETIGPNKPFRDLAWGLADRGIAVLRYEKRTRQYPGKSGGVKDYTVREEVIDDALAAAAFLRTRDRIDPKRVFVLGHSLGGTVAPRIADEDRALAGLVILAGVTRPVFDVVREQLAYLASLNPGTIDQEQALDGLKRAAPESVLARSRRAQAGRDREKTHAADADPPGRARLPGDDGRPPGLEGRARRSIGSDNQELSDVEPPLPGRRRQEHSRRVPAARPDSGLRVRRHRRLDQVRQMSRRAHAVSRRAVLAALALG